MSIIDRRPETPIIINDNDVNYCKINFNKGDDGDSIDKLDREGRIRDRLKGEVEVSDKLKVSFSKNYAETQRKGAPEGVTYVMDKDWQSWNSINLPILEDNSVIGDNEELTDYAFVIPWEKEHCYIILYFSKESMESLLLKKEEYQSFRDKENKRKFDFYFTYGDNDKAYIQNVSIIRKLLNRLKDFFA